MTFGTGSGITRVLLPDTAPLHEAKSVYQTGVAAAFTVPASRSAAAKAADLIFMNMKVSEFF
jgi:hypothetical protein